MQTVKYISASKAMELVFHKCKDNPSLFAKTFRLIKENGLEFPLSDGKVLVRKYSTQVRYAIVTIEIEPDELEAEVEESESEARVLAMWDNI